MSLRVALADMTQMMKEGLKAILLQLGEVEIVAEADGTVDIVELCKTQALDLAVIDLELSGSSGLRAASEIFRNTPEVKVILLSASASDDVVVRAMNAGVRAFILKSASSGDLLDAVRTVARGGTYLSAALADRLMDRALQANPRARRATVTAGGLTPREVEVVRLLAAGKSNREVSGILDISVHTVRSHRQIVMRKVGVGNVVALTQVAISTGLVSQFEPAGTSC